MNLITFFKRAEQIAETGIERVQNLLDEFGSMLDELNDGVQEIDTQINLHQAEVTAIYEKIDELEAAYDKGLTLRQNLAKLLDK